MIDTIFALATAPGRAALAVMRCSGPASGDLLRVIAGALPEPRRATLRRLRYCGEVFDQALVLWFPGPGSFTGEDAFELHLHGGAATVQAASEALIGLGARLAEPGEFSRRAFQAGRLSLVQAEAIADLVDAETKAQRRQALDQLGGALDQVHAEWRGKLIRVASLLAAQVDFADEDVPETIAQAEAGIRELLADLAHQDRSRRGEQVRNGFRIALIGAPNAGKSSLLNALIGRDAAIVTSIPGTTRDIIEAPLDLAGYKVLIADTAGLRTTEDLIEAEGVRRARAWAERADLRLLVVDGSVDRALRDTYDHPSSQGDLILLSKSDSPRFNASAGVGTAAGLEVVPVSVRASGGLDRLRERLRTVIVDRLGGSEFPAITRARHRVQLDVAARALSDALSSIVIGPELAADDVRRAMRALQSVVGQVGVEDVLGGVFATFCVGK